MKNYEFVNGNTRLIRVQKRTAEKIFKSGGEILVSPVNLHPAGSWCNGLPLNPNKPFNTQINSFEYYNCSCNEAGLYASFYKVEYLPGC